MGGQCLYHPGFLHFEAIRFSNKSVVNSLCRLVGRVTEAVGSLTADQPCIIELIKHQLVSCAAWLVVKVSNDDERTFEVAKKLEHLFSFKQTAILILIIKMRRNEVNCLAVDLHLNADHAATFGFSLVLIHTVIDAANGKARKNRNSIFAALIVEIWSKGIFHPRQLR